MESERNPSLEQRKLNPSQLVELNYCTCNSVYSNGNLMQQGSSTSNKIAATFSQIDHNSLLLYLRHAPVVKPEHRKSILGILVCRGA